MPSVVVALIAVILTGCASQPSKPPAPPSVVKQDPPAGPTTPPDPAPVPAVPAPSPPGPAAPAPPPSISGEAPPAPAPVPAPEFVYVKTSLANFRQGAGVSMKILRVLRLGARLQVLETRNAWLRVRLDDGQEGWVAQSVTSTSPPVAPARAPTLDGGSPEA